MTPNFTHLAFDLMWCEHQSDMLMLLHKPALHCCTNDVIYLFGFPFKLIWWLENFAHLASDVMWCDVIIIVTWWLENFTHLACDVMWAPEWHVNVASQVTSAGDAKFLFVFLLSWSGDSEILLILRVMSPHFRTRQLPKCTFFPFSGNPILIAMYLNTNVL